MRLAASNIAWHAADDMRMHALLRDMGYTGLEIAPTRVFPENPYDHLDEATAWADEIRSSFGLSVPSMQSIWYGRSERIAGEASERELLLSYTARALDFAHAVSCQSLVFGCPINRALHGVSPATAISFLESAARIAAARGAVLALEANPPIYGTDFMNSTKEAQDVCRQAGVQGLAVNLDLGAMVAGGETARDIDLSLVSHVHISEPGLVPIKRRSLHRELAVMLHDAGYIGFVSLEMAADAGKGALLRSLEYVAEVFR